MTGLIILMTLSYLVTFIGGFIYGRDQGKKQQIKTFQRWTTYDREGKLRQ